MLLLKNFNSFNIYNILLIFIFSITVNKVILFPTINLISYSILHFILIYLGIYYYKKLLYLIFFLYGLGLDMFWLNEIGPHLIIFLFILVFFNLTKRYLYNINSLTIYFLILFFQIIMIYLELMISNLFFGLKIEYFLFFQIIFLSILISYPIFFIFSKIDRLN